MNGKKIIAVLSAAALVLTLASCGGKTPDEPQTQPAETTAAVEEIETQLPADDVTEALTEADVVEGETQPEAPTQAEDETQEPAEETTEAEKKVPETKEEIVEFYKAAATETDKNKPTFQVQMAMKDLDGGSGAAGKAIDLFKPIAKSALEKNSGTTTGVTGGYKNLTADDVASATAKDDGKYTTIHMTLKQQVDGMNGKSQEGHVGHAISVLPGLQTALDELKGLDLDTSEGTVSLTYNNAYVDVKVDNATGKIVSGTWHFQVDVKIDNCVGKIGFISAKLDGTKGTVTYDITL